jgi:hypothetical protein
MTVLASAATAMVLALCACSAPSPSSTTSATPGGTASDPQQLSAKDAVTKIMATPKTPKVLGAARGTLEAATGTSSVVAQVLRVQAGPASTLVVWRLKSASNARVESKSFQLARPPLMDTRLLGLVDTATNTTYRPYTYIPAQGNGDDLGCACSDLPDDVDANGDVLYAIVAPLPRSVTTVDVTLPGFDTMKKIPIERTEG